MAPEGMWMAMGSAVGHLLHIGVDGEKKWVCSPSPLWHKMEGWEEPVTLAQ